MTPSCPARRSSGLELRGVIGDLCPRPATLALLSRFFAGCPVKRLDLHYEAVTGPWECLHDGQADLIVHRADKSDPRIEWIDLCKIAFIPDRKSTSLNSSH